MGDGNDILIGGLGNDILVGGTGRDFFRTSDGNDEIYMDIGQDTLVFTPGSDGIDTVYGFTLGQDGDRLLFEPGSVSTGAVDVIVKGQNTEFRRSDGIEDNAGFGTGEVFFTLMGVRVFNAGFFAFNHDISSSVTLFYD
ncbi:MAG: hypothetical protein HC881_22940 [Leptolyngbyaceae cyanobacterium SL_7_1]|nr:hypothetical protein [Leptolyngbyaceae cyanobacterium SL_7_1]